MGVITPWAMNALNGQPLYDGQTLRNLDAGVLMGGQSAMLPLSGCLDPRALQVDVSSDPLVTVSPGPAVVTTAAGPYGTGLDSAWSGTLAARHQTYARIDRVVLEIRDTALLRDAVVRIIPGTPAASPAAPALPTTAIALGRINVPNASGGQAAVVDERLFTAAQGGIIHVPDQAARLRLANPAAGSALYVHEASTEIFWKNAAGTWRALDYDTGWVQIPAVQSGAADARVKADVLYLRGQFSTTSGANWPAGVISLGNIPPSMVPTGITVPGTQTTGTGQAAAGVPSPLQMWITPAGVIQCYSGTASHNTAMISALSGIPMR